MNSIGSTQSRAARPAWKRTRFRNRLENGAAHRAVAALASLALCATLGACGTAKVTARHELGAARRAAPTTVYVADFDLEASNIKSKAGLLPPPPKAPGPLGEILPPLPGTPKDPQRLARDLVDSMSKSLVKDLRKAGLDARRLAPGEPLPASGWLVRGVFTSVNQGNQLQRAVIGFGAGKTDLQLVVDVADLGNGTPEPLYELATAADSGTAPGAGPTIVLGPVGVAARVVIAGKDLERDVTRTASEIAKDVIRRTGGTSTS